MTVVAIHQPTFLPWLGWWDKFVRADVFVLLDDVQFPRTSRGTWINRVRVLVSGEARWITVPVDRAFSGTRSIREMRIDSTKPWRESIQGTLASNYARAPHFGEVMPVVDEVLGASTDRMAEFNEAAIRRIGERLGLDMSTLVRQSDLGIAGASNELLAELCRAVGGDTYLSGDGAGEYLEEAAFARAGLGLVYQEFSPPLYPQPVEPHVPGLSVVDALMNCGWEETLRLVARG